MRLAFRISLLAIGLASFFAATASAGSLVEFANLPERRPATLFGYLARPDQGLSWSSVLERTAHSNIRPWSCSWL